MQQLAHAPGRELGPETWGDRLARARVAAGHTQRSASAALAGLVFCSNATVSRLENRADAPDDPKRRADCAVLLAGVYRFALAPFGLSIEDIPEHIRGKVTEMWNGGPDTGGGSRKRPTIWSDRQVRTIGGAQPRTLVKLAA